MVRTFNDKKGKRRRRSETRRRSIKCKFCHLHDIVRIKWNIYRSRHYTQTHMDIGQWTQRQRFRSVANTQVCTDGDGDDRYDAIIIDNTRHALQSTFPFRARAFRTAAKLNDSRTQFSMSIVSFHAKWRTLNKKKGWRWRGQRLHAIDECRMYLLNRVNT